MAAAGECSDETQIEVEMMPFWRPQARVEEGNLHPTIGSVIVDSEVGPLIIHTR
jgi:hypothetical protein